MAFFCAGFSSEANKSQKKSQKGGSKPVPPPKANGHVTNGPTHKAPPLSTTIPHSNCVDLPHSRKMIVLREYVPQDNRGLSVKGGDSVQVIQQEDKMVLVRNEYGKEGLVPHTHLFAPYTSTRNRRPSNPIRPVASGSSVHELEPKGVPMYPSHSAGRPRHHGMENGDNRLNGARRSTLPANATSTLAHNDFNSNGPSYEQKYSPSSSSGVVTGPSSPSLQQSTSRENFPHNSYSNSSSSSSSFSSAEEEQDRRRCYVHQFENGITRNTGPLSSEETLTRFEGRANSESNLSGRKVRPLPILPPHRNQEGVYLSQQSSHIYSTIGEDTPPPIPPRNIPTTNSANDTYSNPIDAISQDGSSHHSHEWVPHNRVKTVPEMMWSRDEDQQYSAVFNGPVTPSRRLPSHGEPDSDSSSSRRSSKKSSQRNRIRPFLEEEEEFETEGGDHSAPKLRSQTKISKFRKCLWGLYMVTADFEAFDENEVTIQKGEHVSVWNQDDREWYWIVKHASNHTEEGFVPSCFLREIVSSDSKQAHTMELVPQDVSHLPNGGGLMRQHPSQAPPPLEEVPRHRPPSGSQERRSASVRRRSSFGSTGGGRRARLHSDSSVRSGLQTKTPSATSIEKMDIPESPPSSPPPPYSEIDHNGHNFPRFSLSQHSEVRSYGPQMHRTRSHGQVTATGTHLTRPRLHTLSTMPRGGGGGNSQEMYHQPPMAVAGGSGTLV